MQGCYLPSMFLLFRGASTMNTSGEGSASTFTMNTVFAIFGRNYWRFLRQLFCVFFKQNLFESGNDSYRYAINAETNGVSFVQKKYLVNRFYFGRF